MRYVEEIMNYESILRGLYEDLDYAEENEKGDIMEEIADVKATIRELKEDSDYYNHHERAMKEAGHRMTDFL